MKSPEYSLRVTVSLGLSAIALAACGNSEPIPSGPTPTPSATPDRRIVVDQRNSQVRTNMGVNIGDIGNELYKRGLANSAQACADEIVALNARQGDSILRHDPKTGTWEVVSPLAVLDFGEQCANGPVVRTPTPTRDVTAESVHAAQLAAGTATAMAETAISALPTKDKTQNPWLILLCGGLSIGTMLAAGNIMYKRRPRYAPAVIPFDKPKPPHPKIPRPAITPLARRRNASKAQNDADSSTGANEQLDSTTNDDFPTIHVPTHQISPHRWITEEVPNNTSAKKH